MSRNKRRGFRLFISSTFDDFSAERDALHNGVYDVSGQLIVESPFAALRRQCLKAETSFHVVDLRWGISAAASTSYTTMERCLDEVEQACTYSAPNMLVLLGDRYGWRPLPQTIPADEFDRIRAALQDNVLRDLLDRWYELEMNAVPAVYHVRGAESRPQQETERVLQTALAKLSKSLALSTPTHYRTSATEREIEVGLKNRQAGNVNDALLVYLRTIKGLTSEKHSMRYRDQLPDGRIDQEAMDQVKMLKHKLLNNSRVTCRHYELSWSDSGITDQQRYLADFCLNVQADLESRVHRALAERDDDLETAHEAFARTHRQHFLGRTDEQGTIRRYLDNVEAGALIISGPSGTGKTALMAWAAEIAESGEAAVTQRYIGVTPNTSTGAQLAADITGFKTDALSAAQQLAQLHKHIIQKSESPFVLLLDGLDLLPTDDRLPLLGWLPDPWPRHLRVIVSTRDNAQVTQIRETFPTTQNLALGPLQEQEALQLFRSLLSDAGRTVSPTQAYEVRRAFSSCARPLFVRLLADLAATWSGRDQPQIDAQDIPALIDYVFNHLSSEIKHGSVLVTHALGYLAASRYGMSDDELLSALSRNDKVMASFRERHPDSPRIGHLPYIVWAGLHADLSAYLSVRHAIGTDVLDFYHQELSDSAHARIETEMSDTQVHLALASLFQVRGTESEQTWNPNATREALESGYHLLQANEGNTFDDYILNSDYLLAAVQYQSHHHIAGRSRPLPNPAGEFARLLELRAPWNPIAETMLESVLNRSDLLAVCPAVLAQEMANDGIALHNPMKITGARLNCRDPGTAPPRDHAAQITALAVAHDGSLVAAGDSDGRISLRTSNGKLVWCRAGHDTWTTCVALSRSGERIASAGDDGSVYVWHGTGPRMEPITFPSLGPPRRQASSLAFIDEHTLTVLWGGRFYQVNIDTLRAELLPGRESNVGFGVSQPAELAVLVFGPDGMKWAEALDDVFDQPARIIVYDLKKNQHSVDAKLPSSPSAMAMGSLHWLVSTAKGLHLYRMDSKDSPVRHDIQAPIMLSMAADPTHDAFVGLSISHPQLHVISTEGVYRSLSPKWPSLRHDDRPRIIKMMPGGEQAVVGWLSGEIHLVSLIDGNVLHRWKSQPAIMKAAITPQGTLAVGLCPRPGASQPAELTWVGQGNNPDTVENPHVDQLVGAVATSQGELVTADRTGKLAIWEQASLVSKIDLKVELSAIGEWRGSNGIAVTTTTGQAHLIGRVPREVDFGATGFSRRLPLKAIDASGDPPLVACGLINGLVGLWQNRLEWWRPDEDDVVDTTEISAVCLLGMTAFAAGNELGRIRVWDRTTGQLHFDWDPHRGAVIDLVSLNHGEHILSAASDGTIFILDTQTGAVICGTFLSDGVACVGKTQDGGITVLSQAGRLLRFTLEDGTP
ncbi:MAG: NACHT domain-containing protein [Candidatus Thiodiazotropha sp. (ex Codakia rugifera)]|nr:NACHT domain-containing protein [Candidatus Thiodiazotropha sp. (ex Codakia rugifera)]